MYHGSRVHRELPPQGQATPVQTTASGTLTIAIKDFAFNPGSVAVTKGTTVTWVNQDTMQHNVVNLASGSLAEGAYFKSQTLSGGQSYSFRFDNPGTYPYYCSIHPSMKATITVV